MEILFKQRWVVPMLFCFLVHGKILGQQQWPADHFMLQQTDRQLSKFSYQFLVLPTASPDTNCVLLYIKLSNASLQFVKSDTLFRGKYELSVAVQNDKEISDSKIIRRELLADSFHETRDPSKIVREFIDFQMPPGEYEVIMELYDLEIKKPFRKKENLSVPDFRNESIGSTDIFFLSELTRDVLDNLKPLMPPVRLVEDTSFYARIDLFSSQEQNITIFASVRNHLEKPVFHDTLHIQMKGRRQPVFFNLGHRMSFGQYTLHLHLVSGKHEKNLQAKYYIRWYGHPESISDMQSAIGPLYYIMNNKAWNELNAADNEEKKQILDTFWKERDPTPKTALNELEEEFFRRVSFANQHFSVYKGSLPGWRTDRGRTYILYGPPTDVDVPPFRPETRERYEIWIYQNLQRRFIFFNKYGDGDYQLISQE
ncbi:GWxTD domain-containing protein [bacterium]|nr:GWxTD domain-containing protein [bacterium]